MRGTGIYSDFDQETAWIRREIIRDIESLPSSLRSRAKSYTIGRRRILEQGGVHAGPDGSLGTPVIYAAFWFSDALGLKNGRLRQLAGYSLVCTWVAATLRDDHMDSGPAKDTWKAKLAKFWFERYHESLRELFPTEQGFQHVVSSAEAEWRKYRKWQSNPTGSENPHPFSEDFLKESSRYYVACSLPPLVGIAHAAGRNRDAPRIERFLRMFSMGLRIVDDLMDWEEDLTAFQMNRSSVLIYVKNKMQPTGALDRIDVLSCLQSDELLNDAYGAMIGYFRKAWRTAEAFGSPYLVSFMQDVMESQSKERESLLTHATLALSGLGQGLTKILD